MAEIVFVDGIAHYTTVAQAQSKFARSKQAPTAAAGAFGTPGLGFDENDLNNQYNFAASAEREFTVYLKTNSTVEQRNLWALWDNTYPQIFADVQPDGSISIYKGLRLSGGAFSGFGIRDTLLHTIPAGTLQFGVQNLHKVSVLHHGATGTITYQLNGVTVWASAANLNTAPSGAAQSTILYLGYYNIYPGAPRSCQGYLSHLIIGDDIGIIAGQPRLGGLFPDGAGATTAWTPDIAPNWQRVDEADPDDDSSYNESSTVGNIDTYTMQNVPAGTSSIVAVAVTVRIKKTDANSRTVAAVLRIAGNDYVHTTAKGVPGDWAYLQWIWTVSPATGIAFTVAEVNALEAGIKVVA